MRVAAIIPARLKSTRLPQKPLADICGKPMLQWVYEAAKKASGIDEVTIATDSPEIMTAARAFGARVLLTGQDCQSGTERITEAMQTVEADIYINVQGDEPLVDPSALAELAKLMREDSSLGCATLCASISDEDAKNPNTVKVVLDNGNNALYFSRSPIPYARDAKYAKYYGHMGVYAWRKDILAASIAIPPSMLAEAEKLEQLRLLHAGVKIRCIICQEMSLSVDTEADLQMARRLMAKRLDNHAVSSNEAVSPFAQIRLIFLDVDGVLTDGSLTYSETGESLKKFNVKDGLGIIMAQKAGMNFAVVTGRGNAALESRLTELGIPKTVMHCKDKASACRQIQQELGIKPEECLFIGDDLPDLPGFAACGLAVAVADAVNAVKKEADYVTKCKGGHGAVREVVDWVMEAPLQKRQ